MSTTSEQHSLRTKAQRVRTGGVHPRQRTRTHSHATTPHGSMTSVMGPANAPGLSIMGGPSWGLHPDVMGGPDPGPRTSVMGSGDTGTRLDVFGDSDLRSVDWLFTWPRSAR
jgi:hypothetical protein